MKPDPDRDPDRDPIADPVPDSDFNGPTQPADLRTLLASYMACPARSRPRSFLAFVRERNPHVLSHHAHDRSDYREHVWQVGGLYLCRGCMTVIIVTPLAFALALVTRWPVATATVWTAAIFSALLLLALLPLRDGPRTLLRDLRRVALGCLLGSAAAYLLLCDDWLLRGAVIGVYVVVLVGRGWLRRRARVAADAVDRASRSSRETGRL